MEIGTILQNFPPLVFCPDHEGVHGPLDVRLPLGLRVLPVLPVARRGPGGHQLWLGQQRGGRGSGLGRGGGLSAEAGAGVYRGEGGRAEGVQVRVEAWEVGVGKEGIWGNHAGGKPLGEGQREGQD